SLQSLALMDWNQVGRRLEKTEAGSYALDGERCYLDWSACKAFPQNVEIQALQTFSGQSKGDNVPQVTPDDRWISLETHLSLVALPDEGYQTRAFHPRSGCFDFSFVDMAQPLDQPVQQRYIFRHRLVAADPQAEMSQAVEPIVYYVDNGAPAEIQKALLEGASWWKQAFEAAGWQDAFRVEILPEDVDPMDIRYNVIQWVHRSTRGWSYGASAYDPRTAEILKGHVILGSLRVRQDLLILQGMGARACSAAFAPVFPGEPESVALARIRQLAAHEVGHTLGFAHNFIGSAEGRSSVMDYPAPLVRQTQDGLDFSEAYAQGIGAWDVLAVRYAYGRFPDEKAGLAEVLKQAKTQGLSFIGDEHARGVDQFQVQASLWDNGSEPVVELERIMALRAYCLQHLNPKDVAADQPAATLEEYLVPIFLLHRYQLEACGKSLGGYNFQYDTAGETQSFKPVAADRQNAALAQILKTLDDDFLKSRWSQVVPPRPPGYPAHRELFSSRNGGILDDSALAETSIQLTFEVLLASGRLHRIHQQAENDQHQLSLSAFLSRIGQVVFQTRKDPSQSAVHRLVQVAYLTQLNQLLKSDLRSEVRYLIQDHLAQIQTLLKGQTPNGAEAAAHRQLLDLLEKGLAAHGESVKNEGTIPPGSPIGILQPNSP
ncbi:MAG: zinc-dependent metalloprotease, partial [Acidobacteria bacterium]|nr:zinc-dependent metalloprotease [Acidobacteriota bacterium]